MGIERTSNTRTKRVMGAKTMTDITIDWRKVNDEPENTCPQIDGVLEIVDNLEHYLKDIKEEMERVRTQNENLREWGKSLERELVRVEEELDAARLK